MYTVPIPLCMFSEQTRARIGEAIYLLGHLIQRSNWESDVTHITHSAICEETGLPPRTIERWMRALRENGFITTRRTAFGTLVTIHNYEPISHTHGVSYKPRNNPPKVAQPLVDDPPEAVNDPAINGACNPPPVTDGSARYGVSNIKEILSPNKINYFKRPSSPSVDAPDAQASGPCESNDADANACRILDSMTDNERAELRRRTLERMLNSRARHLTTFVRCDESGELGTYDNAGEEVVAGQMIETLKAEAISNLIAQQDPP